MSFPAYVIFVVFFASQEWRRDHEIADKFEPFTSSIFFDFFLTFTEGLASLLCRYSYSSYNRPAYLIPDFHRFLKGQPPIVLHGYLQVWPTRQKAKEGLPAGHEDSLRTSSVGL